MFLAHSQILRFIICLLLLAFQLDAFCSAQQDKAVTFIEGLKSAGISFTQNDGNLQILVDKDIALSVIPVLSNRGVISQQLTYQNVLAHPVEFAGQIGLLYTAAIIPYVYQTRSADALAIELIMISQGDDEELKNTYATFSFDRTLYQSTDWSKLSINELVERAKNFTFTEWYKEQIVKER